MQFLLQGGVVLVFLALGFTCGTLVERAHFRRLQRREAKVRDMLVTDTKTLPIDRVAQNCGMVTGEVVIASDYFKSFAAALRKLVGGELRTFESLMDRARREALLRMLESAKGMGANAVINVRFATSNIGSMRSKRSAAMVEMYAYGTALKTSEPSSR